TLISAVMSVEKPTLKSRFQNKDCTTSAGRCRSHAIPKVSGPVPATRRLADAPCDALMVDSVVLKDGRTSREESGNTRVSEALSGAPKRRKTTDTTAAAALAAGILPSARRRRRVS